MELLNLAGIYAGTFLFCAMSGIVPVMNTEVFLLYIGATANPAALPALVVLAALGQMSAKCVLYFGGRGILKLPRGHHQAQIEAMRARLTGGRWAASSLTFVSALTGFPPFYGTSIVAGTLGWPLSRFLVSGTVGRLLRFTAVLFLPGLLKGVMQ